MTDAVHSAPAIRAQLFGGLMAFETSGGFRRLGSKAQARSGIQVPLSSPPIPPEILHSAISARVCGYTPTSYSPPVPGAAGPSRPLRRAPPTAVAASAEHSSCLCWLFSPAFWLASISSSCHMARIEPPCQYGVSSAHNRRYPQFDAGDIAEPRP